MGGRWCLLAGLVPFRHPQQTRRLNQFNHFLVTLFGNLVTKRGQNQEQTWPKEIVYATLKINLYNIEDKN